MPTKTGTCTPTSKVATLRSRRRSAAKKPSQSSGQRCRPGSRAGQRPCNEGHPGFLYEAGTSELATVMLGATLTEHSKKGCHRSSRVMPVQKCEAPQDAKAKRAIARGPGKSNGPLRLEDTGALWNCLRSKTLPIAYAYIIYVLQLYMIHACHMCVYRCIKNLRRVCQNMP